MSLPLLPEDFLWGTATSAHQIEGDNVHSDWWSFELARGLSPSGRAAAFTSRFEADLDEARALGTNAFRFSLEWARVEPREGEEDAAGWSFYEALVEACLARGLTPMLTLLHFTLPRWAAEAGGWLNPATAVAFRRHAERVGARFAGRVRLFATLNEPNVQVSAGYIAGVFPPGRRLRPDLAARAMEQLVLGHAAAYEALHAAASARGATVEVGVVQHLIDWRPSPWDPGGWVARQAERFNASFLEALEVGVLEAGGRSRAVPSARGTMDFLGINYYMSLPTDLRGALYFAGLLRPPASVLVSDLGWPIAPAGLRRVIVAAWERYRRPIYVTENGLADAGDGQRADFLVGHVRALREAVAAGAEVRGYFHWSLLDNFEWHQGFGPRFGLVAVDYANQARRVRGSGWVYEGLIRRRGAAPGEPDPR